MNYFYVILIILIILQLCSNFLLIDS